MLGPTLTAVAEGRTTTVDFDPWFRNAGPTAARVVQGEIVRVVGG